jgi:hypothetical protein
MNVSSQESSVAIVMGYELYLISGRSKQQIFLFFTVSRLALAPIQPSIQWVLEVLSQGVQWLGHETKHSTPLVSRSWMVVLYLHSPIYLHGVVLN